MKLIITALIATVSLTCAQEAKSLFNGTDLTGWKGEGYEVKDGAIICAKGGKNLMTEKEYDNYVFEFNFLLPPRGNNGLGINYGGTGNPSSSALELQILDNSHPKYAKLKDTQCHGSIYKLHAAKRGFLKPVGEWNHQKVTAKGPRLIVELNGTVILDANLDDLRAKNPKHKGLKRTSGHITFCGHGDPVQFKNITIVELPATSKKN